MINIEQNYERGRLAAKALEQGPYGLSSMTNATTDLLTDLMHLHGEDAFNLRLTMARNHYQAETSDDE